MINIFYVTLFCLLICSDLCVNGELSDGNYKFKGKNSIDNLFNTDQLAGDFYSNNFLRNDVLLEKDNPSPVNNVGNKFDSRSMVEKRQMKNSIMNNKKGEPYTLPTMNQNQKPNIKGLTSKYNTAMTIECLFSVKNCMSMMTDVNNNKFDRYKIPYERNYPKLDYYSHSPHLTPWISKKEPRDVLLKKMYEKVYGKGYLS
uniref:Apicortin n=1 Tax=Strongyloides papillosus TaxID=174720 RepID=A0A0N5BK36_STREA